MQNAISIAGGSEPDWQHIHSLIMVVQGIVPEEEWDAFITQLRTPLPTTFRINGRGKFAADLRNSWSRTSSASSRSLSRCPLPSITVIESPCQAHRC